MIKLSANTIVIQQRNFFEDVDLQFDGTSLMLKKEDNKLDVYSTCWDWNLKGSVVRHRVFFKFFSETNFKTLLKNIKKKKNEKVVQAEYVGRQIKYELRKFKEDNGCKYSRVEARQSTTKRKLQPFDQILQYPEPKEVLYKLGLNQTSESDYYSYYENSGDPVQAIVGSTGYTFTETRTKT